MTLNQISITTELDWFKRWSIYAPDKIALQNGETEEKWTYAQIYKQILETSLFLKNKFNISTGQRVAALSENSVEYIVLFFALQRLGAILVPLNYRLTESEITNIITDCEPQLLIYQIEYLNAALAVNKKNGTDIFKFNFLFNNDSFNNVNFDSVECFPTDENLATMILYTSGTTGNPKGVTLTHKVLFWNSINTTISLNLTENDSAVIFLPFFHTGGWNVLSTPFLHRGAKLIILKKFDAKKVLSISAKEKTTVLFGVPTTMDMMSREKEFSDVDLSSIRFAIVGGEPMPLELIKKWQNKKIAIRQGYGLTEFGPNVFSLKQEDTIKKIGSIGFANFYVEAKIIDELGEAVTANQVGELILKGPMCMQGYWNNYITTAETIKNNWLYTGDLAKKDSEGYYYIVGRKKDMYISGAENVYPAEVEKIIGQIVGVKEVAVVGVKDAMWGEVGRAFIVLDNKNLSESDIFEYCLKNLAKYKIPKKIIFLEVLPKGHSGKILKKDLPLIE